MPEGDTIFRAARTLHRALAGQTRSLGSQDPRTLKTQDNLKNLLALEKR